jgi:hypothetical protein
VTSLLAKEVTTACCGCALSRTVCERLPMSNITLSAAQLSALISTEVAKALAAQPRLKPSDFKIVLVENIPSKSGSTFATIEITPAGGESTVLFVDRIHDAGERKDGAAQTIFYASKPKPLAAKGAAPAVAKRAAKRKPAVKAETVDEIAF